MRFKGLDLNLLAALDVLLDELNVSRAATRMHISQPAMSAALARLRSYFDDPLLVVDGKRMIPTAQALRLREHVRTLLADVEVLTLFKGEFDPAISTRVFRIGASDYLTSVVFVDLLQQLAVIAPGLAFEFFAPGDDTNRMLTQGGIDLLTGPEELLLSDHPAELFFEEKHVVAGWAGNAIFKGNAITTEDFSDASHVAVQIGAGGRPSFAESRLSRLGVQRRVAVIVPSFAVVPELLVNTNRLAVMHERMARRAALHLPIVFAPMPFKFPLMREVLQYHRARSADPGLTWLRAVLCALVNGEEP